jgi:hypothetical protein
MPFREVAVGDARHKGDVSVKLRRSARAFALLRQQSFIG